MIWRIFHAKLAFQDNRTEPKVVNARRMRHTTQGCAAHQSFLFGNWHFKRNGTRRLLPTIS
jgi:hypothetical protein